jgi:alpha-beta hydrolase superfamily lysophospholipase
MQTLLTEDDLPLHVRVWSARSEARGTVLIVHGLGEHCGRHERLADELNGAGFHVVSYDHRGHGASGGDRGRIAEDDSLLRDLAGVISAVRARHDGPLVLLGHSMGGLVAARFVAEALDAQPADWSRQVEGLVLSSPALDPGMSTGQTLALAVASRFAPDRALGNGLKPEWLSRDAAVVGAYKADPMVHDRITPRLVRFIVEGGRLVRSRAACWRVPTLLMWAGADRCVAPAGSAAFAQAAPAHVLTAREFAGLYHEIFNEPERAEVMAELLRWLDRHGA